jgi:hypothetical protein
MKVDPVVIAPELGVVGLLVSAVEPLIIEISTIVDDVVRRDVPNASGPIPDLLGPIDVGLVSSIFPEPGCNVEEASVRDSILEGCISYYLVSMISTRFQPESLNSPATVNRHHKTTCPTDCSWC